MPTARGGFTLGKIYIFLRALQQVQSPTLNCYLDSALLSYRTGLLTGNGINSNYSYLNTLSGYSWQSVILNALKEELKKASDGEQTQEAKSEDENGTSLNKKKKEPDWATIRVIEHYKSPLEQPTAERKGMLV